tara:strand:- start:711 stop:1436 length:726 start_codon:yes stop_codon:yes gene_type:complete
MDIKTFSQVNKVVELENGKLPKFEQTVFYKHARCGVVIHDEPVQAGDYISQAAPGFNGWDFSTYFVLEAEDDEAVLKPVVKQGCPVLTIVDDLYLEDDLFLEVSAYVYELSQYNHKMYFKDFGFEEQEALEYEIVYDTIIVDAGEIVKAGEASVKTDLQRGNEIDGICFCYIKEGMLLATQQNDVISYKLVQAVHQLAGFFVLCDIPESDIDLKFIPKIKQAMQEQQEYLKKTKTLKEFLS